MSTDSDWRKLLSVQEVLQSYFPDLVLVGGTASALHAGHRVSLDADHVLTDLRVSFDKVLADLEALAGWKTSRSKRPVLILGKLEGVETGIRQLIRQRPLETETIQGIRVPTLPEMLRIKAWLVVTRNKARDFLDTCALADKLGPEGAIKALETFDALYPQESGETVTRQLCKQLAQPLPDDLEELDLAIYRELQPPWNSWPFVKERCLELSDLVASGLLGLGGKN